MSTNLDSQFEQLGLTSFHADIYLALLDLGKATLKALSEKTDIPRSSCYEYVPGLVRIGLASEVTEGKTRYIVPESPEKIVALLQEQKDAIANDLKKAHDLLGELVAQYQSIQDRPSVKFLKGVEGIKTVLDETLQQKKEILVLCQGDESEHHLDEEPEYLRTYFAAFKKGKCKSREIIEDRGDAKEYKRTYEDKNQKILLAPPIKKLKTTHIDKIIYGNKVAIIAFVKELAILIEDSLIAQNERLTFNVLWNSLRSSKYKYSY